MAPCIVEPLESRLLLSGAPSIASLHDNPDPVPPGGLLSLTALGVVAASRVDFYRDVNGNGSLDPGVDTLVGSDTTVGSGSANIQVPTANLPLGYYTYFARATDALGQTSNVVSTTNGHRDNAAPLVGSLTASPDPVGLGATLTLTAVGVSDPDGNVARVDFFRDTNGNGSLDRGTDLLVGASSGDGPIGGFRVDVALGSLGAGTYKYFAQAVDSDGDVSNVVAAFSTVEAVPTIQSLAAALTPVQPGQTITLTATGIAGADPATMRVDFYRDANADGVFQLSDLLLGSDATIAGGVATFDASTVSLPTGSYTFFARATELIQGKTSNVVAASAEVRANERPTVGSLDISPNPAEQGQTVTLTAINPADSDGTIVGVDFYRDVNGNGVLEVGLDPLVGSASVPGPTMSVAIDISALADGVYTYFARATDDDGATSLVVTATGSVGVALGASPAPVREGQPFRETFEALSAPPGPWEYASSNAGRVTVTGGKLAMEDTARDGVKAVNQAVLHLDLAGQNHVRLRLSADKGKKESGGGDGLFIRNDGSDVWQRFAKLKTDITGKSFDLDAIAAAKGIALDADVQLMLRQQGDGQPGKSGIRFDDLEVSSGSAARHRARDADRATINALAAMTHGVYDAPVASASARPAGEPRDPADVLDAV